MGQRAEPARTPVKERVKAHGRNGNEDSRRRGDDGSRCRPREHAASIASSGAQRGGSRGRWDDHGRTARLSNLRAQWEQLKRQLLEGTQPVRRVDIPKPGGGGREINAHGLRYSAATILLNQVGKDLREIQELLRHKNIRTTVCYTHVGYEQTRQTAEALSQALE